MVFAGRRQVNQNRGIPQLQVQVQATVVSLSDYLFNNGVFKVTTCTSTL